MARRGGSLLLVAVAALAAACTTTVQGAPLPANQPDRITAKAALGEFTTADPCSLVRIGDLPLEYTAQFDARFDIPSAVDTCLITMEPKGADFVDVEWGLLQDAGSMAKQGPWQREDLGHGLGLWTNESAERCLQELVFADDIAMTIRTTAYGGKPGALCATGKPVVDLIVKSVRTKTAARRAMPANSLAHQDACKLLPQDLADTMPGAADAKPDRVFPTGHQCHYSTPHLDMELVFTVDAADRDRADDEEPVTIAGRSSLQSQGYRDEYKESRCWLSTAHVPITSTSYSRRATEGLLLMVVADGKSASICTDATKIAEQIWQKLPA